MKEFDYCPGCKAGLLLEDPDTGGKGLRCLDCGYTCEASGPQAVGAEGVVSGLVAAQLDYWKRRCEAAESVIAYQDAKHASMYFKAHQAWLEVIAAGEPA
ncbi:MAG: hypothetical protein OEV73_05450 [Desulfobulbaceae bacterium]|nr:hypothetical protein [Desulfobulbaceae bacterium]